MPSFHCNARYFLITYAQCGDLSEWDVLEHIGSLGAECIIARENHQTLGVHLHVFVDFGRKFRSRKTDVFDVHGRHANIQPSRGTPEKGYDYAIKDGDVVAGGLERPEGRVGSGKNFDLWTQITDAADREEFWSLVQELDPKSLCCSFGQLQKYADWKYTPTPPVYESPGGFTFVGGDVDGRDSWVSAVGLGLGQSPVEGTQDQERTHRVLGCARRAAGASLWREGYPWASSIPPGGAPGHPLPFGLGRRGPRLLAIYADVF